MNTKGNNDDEDFNAMKYKEDAAVLVSENDHRTADVEIHRHTVGEGEV